MARNKTPDVISEQELEAAQALLDSGVAEQAPSVTAAPVKKPKRKTVIFHNQDGDVGVQDIFVSVNGKAYQIKREVEVELPIEVIHVIDNAIITKFSRDEKGKEIVRDVKRYPYTAV